MASFGPRERPTLWIGLATFALAFAGYWSLARAWAATPIYLTNNNVFFGADHLEPIKTWAKLGGDFHHEGAHPLTILLFSPLATALAGLLGTQLSGVLALTVSAGAVAVALAYSACSRWLNDPVRALAPTLVFAFSMSQMIFATLPETYGMVGASLALAYLLLADGLTGSRLRFGAWVAAGLLAFGVLITAFIQPLIAFTAVVLAQRRNLIRSLLLYLGVTLALAVSLSLLQSLLFPSTEFFLSPAIYTEQAGFVDLTRLIDQPGQALTEVGRHLFLLNLVGRAPTPVVRGDNPDLFFAYTGTEPATFLGGAALMLWLALLVDGVIQNAKSAAGRIYLMALGVILVFNAALYSVFNPAEMFLYSTTVLLPVLLLGVARPLAHSTWRGIAWWGLAALVAANNTQVVVDFLALLNHL